MYHPDKTDKIDRLIKASGSKMALKTRSVVKWLMYVLKLFELSLAIFTRFGSVVKKRFVSCILSIQF